MQNNLSSKILKLAKKRKRRIAIGLIKTNTQIITSLKKAKRYADILVIGKKVKGFECIEDKNKPGQTLARVLVEKKVDGIVRGNLVAGEVMHVFAEELGYKQVLRVGIVRDLKGREFFIGPGGVAEGNNVKQRLELALKVCDLMQRLKIKPKVGVLSIDETRDRTKLINQSIDEAQHIVTQLKRRKIDAEWLGYAVEKAVDKANYIVPPSGIIGNFIWRSIVGFGGGVDLGDPGLIDEVFVDDSKYWDDYLQPIVCAVALANLKNISLKRFYDRASHN